jgi:rubrerythrin
MTENTTGWLLETAIGWERQAADYYSSLASAFSGEPGVSNFWLRMSADEDSHAESLEEIRAAVSAARLEESISRDERAMVGAGDALFVRMSSARVETLDDAYEMAHELEGSEINSVFRVITLGIADDPAVREALLRQADVHVERLTEFGRLFDRAHRMAIEAGS